MRNDRSKGLFLLLVSLVTCLAIVLGNLVDNYGSYYSTNLKAVNSVNLGNSIEAIDHLFTPPAQAQAAPAQLLLLYQPIQNIVWEGQFTSSKGIAYFSNTGSNTGEAQLGDYASGDLNRAGIALHANGEYDRAIAKYLASLEQVRTGNSRDQAQEIMLLGNLGLAYAATGLYYEAVDYFNQFFAQTWHKAYYYQGTDPKLGGIALGNIGKIFFAAEYYLKALEFQEKCLELSKEIGDRLGKATALGDLGVAYQSIGDYQKSIDYQKQALSLAESLGDGVTIARSLSYLGVIYHTLRDYAKALEFQQRCLDLVREQKDYLGEIQALGNLGGAYYFLGNLDQAISLYNQALEVSFRIAEARMAAIIRSNLGLAYFQKNIDNSPGEETQQQTINFYKQFLNFVPINTGRLEGVVRNNFAVTYSRFNNPVAAETQFSQGLEAWEKVRQKLGDNDAYKILFLETQGAIYNNFQKLLTDRNQPERSLEISERSRAKAFVELLSRRLIPNAPRTQKVDPLTIAQIKAIAEKQNATLVEYSVIYEDFFVNQKRKSQESELFIWVVKPSGEVSQRRVDLKPLWRDKQTSLGELVDQTRDALGVGRGNGRATYPALLRELHQLLINPIEDLLPTPIQGTEKNRLIIIPHRSLFLLPFPALQDAQGKYLIDKYILQTAPSIQVLQLTQQQRQRAEGSEVLIVGNPTMPVVQLPGLPPQRLDNLPGAEQEAKAIAQLFQVSALTGDQASKIAVLRKMPQAKIIHLATHGLLDDFSGSGVPGAIALAPSPRGNVSSSTNPTNSSQNQDLLTANEILNLRLSSKLVVLSACDTGRGKITGDGVIGLSRSLIAAGAASVLVSLWAIPDSPTAELMQDFYQQLQANPDEAVALQKAMVTTKAKYPHPKNWAAFTLIGESS